MSQVSGMTSSLDCMCNNTFAGAGAGAGAGSVAEDTATAALARTGKNKSVDTMLAASVVAAAAAEGAEETSADVATLVRLIKPVGKTGSFWSYYKLDHPNHHPEKQNLAHCTLCQTDTSFKGRTTTGLTKHLQYKHREEYESMNDNKADGSQTSVASIFPKRVKEPDIQDRKMRFIYVVRNFIMRGVILSVLLRAQTSATYFVPSTMMQTKSPMWQGLEFEKKSCLLVALQ